jgi:hypothetical protein
LLVTVYLGESVVFWLKLLNYEVKICLFETFMLESITLIKNLFYSFTGDYLATYYFLIGTLKISSSLSDNSA